MEKGPIDEFAKLRVACQVGLRIENAAWLVAGLLSLRDIVGQGIALDIVRVEKLPPIMRWREHRVGLASFAVAMLDVVPQWVDAGLADIRMAVEIKFAIE